MACPVEIRLIPSGNPVPEVASPGFVFRSPRGVVVEYRLGSLSGGDLLHLAVAGCLFNGLVRVARERRIELSHAVVAAEGEFNDEGTRSTGITYRIEIDGDAGAEELRALAEFVEKDASVPEIGRAGASVVSTDVVVGRALPPEP